MQLMNIFMAFFKASILSYGGGPASIPLMRGQIVDVYKWCSNNQFADALAIANTLPGPIAPKMAAYIGNEVGGLLGAVVGVIASVVPTAILVVILGKVLLSIKDTPRMQSMLRVAKPIVVILLLQSAIQLMTRSNYTNVSAYIVSIVTFIAIIFFKINAGIIMILGLSAGVMFYKIF